MPAETDTQPGETFLVRGQNYWGYSENSIAEAKAVFKDAGGRLNGGYEVFTFDDQTEFISIGGVYGEVSYARRDGGGTPNPPKVEKYAKNGRKI